MPIPRLSNARPSRSTLCAMLIAIAVSSLNAQTPSDLSLLRSFRWRSIGPANTGGRVSDVEAVVGDAKTVWVGFASSGLWKTTNNGISWRSLFDEQSVASIGDLAIDPRDPDVVWVGTGEPNSRNSSPWGAGVFRSTDGGDSWQSLGLRDTHHIGRVRIDPRDSNTVYVAALGHLWGTNPERGLYKTTDAGETWRQILYIDERSGVVDVAIDPTDPDVVYAASYERQRGPTTVDNPVKRWGPGSGIHVSRDAGKTWARAHVGLPGAELGRIGLACAASRPGRVYAIVETPSEGTIFGFGNRPAKTDDLDVERGGLFRSDDYGETWVQINEFNERPFYFSEISVDPSDADTIWYSGLRLYRSTDGGRSFENRGGSQHGDFHGVWIDPDDPEHVVAAQDGGVGITFDGGLHWDLNLQMATAQCYEITADEQQPYWVYSGLQDNGSWAGPSRTRSGLGIRNRDWFQFLGGDGFHVKVDPTDPQLLYCDHEYGRLWRVALGSGDREYVQPHSFNVSNFAEHYPSHPIPDRPDAYQPRSGLPTPFRFEWNAPLVLSAHNPHTLYFGANHLLRSIDRGDSWRIISPNLTSDPPTEAEGSPWAGDRHSAILSIEESPRNANEIWVGTNDGGLWLTRDGGSSWQSLVERLAPAPSGYHVKRIEASQHVDGRAYLVLDGHTLDDPRPFVYVTEDYGQTWRSLARVLPEGSAYVIREDPKNPELLFVGTEFALFVTLNRGRNWHRFMNGLPTVAVHDLLIHPRDGDLIAGTHGRGVWIADDITPLQQLSPELLDAEAKLFAVRPSVQWSPRIESRILSDKEFRADNPKPGSRVHFYLREFPGQVELEISDIVGRRRHSVDLSDRAMPGIQGYDWDHGFDDGPPAAEPGQYLVRLVIDGRPQTQVLTILPDPSPSRER